MRRREFTLVIDGHQREGKPWPEKKVRASINELMDQGKPASQIARQLARKCFWPRREIYKIVIEMEKEDA